MRTHVKPDENIGESLEEKEGNKREHRDEREQLSGGFSLGQPLVGGRVADEENGDGGEAYVGHHVLIVAGLSSNLGGEEDLGQ